MSSQRLAWADLHNHNAVGYGLGSLQRSLRLARQRLDVWAFTAHAQWADIPQEWTDADVQRHLAGFQKVREAWPDVVSSLAGATDPGKFVTLAGFEWHSSRHGDRHVLLQDAPAELPGELSLAELEALARRRRGVLIPHHLAYPPGARGVSWPSVNDAASPVAEIFSEHGSSEIDDGRWPMDGHSMSPRSTRNTWVEGLRSGLYLGAIASTDNHDGCPAAYGEGLAGLWLSDMTAGGVIAALYDRRCFAVTGDRIALDWSLAGAPMGSRSVSRPSSRLPIRIEVSGWDQISHVDLIRNGQLLKRWSPALAAGPEEQQATSDEQRTTSNAYIIRARWGWGRMAARDIYAWNMSLRVEGGRLRAAMPGFGSSTPTGDESGDGAWELISDRECRFWSRTSRSFAQPFDQFAWEIEGGPQTRLVSTIEFRAGEQQRFVSSDMTLESLLAASHEYHLWPPPFTPTFQWNRALRRGACTARIADMVDCEIPAVADGWSNDCFYVRVQQQNGQMAWASPIWFAP